MGAPVNQAKPHISLSVPWTKTRLQATDYPLMRERRQRIILCCQCLNTRRSKGLEFCFTTLSGERTQARDLSKVGNLERTCSLSPQPTEPLGNLLHRRRPAIRTTHLRAPLRQRRRPRPLPGPPPCLCQS